MKILRQTAKSTLIWGILISLLYVIIGEIIFQVIYYHDNLLNQEHWLIISLSIGYTLPIVIFFRNRYWYFSIFILFFYLIFTFILMFLFGALFPLPDDNPAGGILIFLLHGTNVFGIVLGVIFGLLINLILYLCSKLEAMPRKDV